MNEIVFIALVIVALALAEAVYYVARFIQERPADDLKRRLRTIGTQNAGIQILRSRRLPRSTRMRKASRKTRPVRRVSS